MQKQIKIEAGYRVIQFSSEKNDSPDQLKRGSDFFVLHGYGANAEDLVPIASYLKSSDGDRFFFPNAPIALPSPFPGLSSLAWSELSFSVLERCAHTQDRDLLRSHLEAGVIAAAAALKPLTGALKLRAGRTIFCGFSQGAMVAEELTWICPELAFGLCLFSTGLDRPTVLAEQVVKQPNLKIFQSHGRQDQVLPFFLAESISASFNKAINDSQRYRFRVFAGGHEIPPAVLSEAKDFFSRA